MQVATPSKPRKRAHPIAPHLENLREAERERGYEHWIKEFEELVSGRRDLIDGKCWENSTLMQLMFPDLRVVWGWVNCEKHATWPHWYCIAPDGSVCDPTRSQFEMIRGYGEWPKDAELPIGCCPGCMELLYDNLCGKCGFDMEKDLQK